MGFRGVTVVMVLALAGGCGEISRDTAEVITSSPESRANDVGYTPPGEKAGTNMGQGAELNRKIIYNAQVSLVVKDFSVAQEAIQNMVQKYGGFLADASVSQHQGDQRHGRWVARIPVDGYNRFLDELAEVGVRVRQNQKADDVTEEFVDLEARIATKKKLEERILELLETRDGEIKDVIDIERELARVRSDIEQMEGRLRFLENRTSLTTVTIEAREQQGYAPAEAPGLGAALQRPGRDPPAPCWERSRG